MAREPARVCLGVVVASKGLRGEVRVKSYTEDPQDVAAYGPVSTDNGRMLKLTVTGSGKGVVIAKVDGVDDRTQADALKGLNLYVDRGALPPPGADSLYQADLIGLLVERIDGETLGMVTAFHNFGGGDVMEVENAGGQAVLIPFAETAIAEVDVKGRRILVTPLPGLFDGDGSGDLDAGDQATAAKT